MNASSIWEGHAARAVRRWNLAWWLQAFAPAAGVVSLAVFGTVFYARSQGRELPGGLLAAGITGVYALAGLGAWWRVRRRFSQKADGFVRLESHLRLNNALTAAAHGVTAWPDAPPVVDDGVRFRSSWLAAPAALSVTCLLLAFLLPVPEKAAAVTIPPPQALDRAEAILTTLEAQQVADPAALEKAREQLDALKAQDPQEYYSHHSLEAADTLETSLQHAAGEMGRNLQTAAQSAESLEKFDSSLSPAARQQLESDFQNAVEGIKNSSLGKNEALMKQLQGMDPSKLKQLDPKQLEKMLQNLKAKGEACKNCQGQGRGDGQSEAEKALNDLLNGKGKGNGDGECNGEGDGEEMGRGGVIRGPGTGPLRFEKNESELGTSKLEMLENSDLTRTLPGDNLGTTDMEHQLDKSPTGPSAGGGVAAPGTGGDAVWRDQLLPAERKVLRGYFK
ncbi:MAG: hypothetical protein V4726_10170 [Verrucomicrobiota bacterium]